MESSTTPIRASRFERVLVANRGEIALRIFRTLRALGVQTVAVFSEVDGASRHVVEADEAYCIGAGPAAESYLDAQKIIDVALRAGVQAIHPGYGFLSESASFVEACEEAGLVFIGPTAENIRIFGLKHRARAVAERSDVPLLPGSPLLETVEEAVLAAECVGYPVMLKSTAGGGGIGMAVCRDSRELEESFARIERISEASFGRAGLFVEKYVSEGRHVEVQIFGDGEGAAIALGERDCSSQRRNQKVIEESPAPGLSDAVREELLSASVRLASAGRYRSAGTVEYIYAPVEEAFYFLEMNTRIQVEHGVTEEITGVDLIEWMVRLASGSLPALSELDFSATGHAIEARVYAEDPARDFRPSTGILTDVELPDDLRVDGWIERGTAVSPYYDPLLAKLVVHARSRNEAIDALVRALERTQISGIETNVRYLREILSMPRFRDGDVSVRMLDSLDYRPDGIEITRPGTQTSIQDHPGRVGFWSVGVPPSGPMDDVSFRLANRLVGNPPGASALEFAVSGPTIRFHEPVVFCLAGAEMDSELEGRAVERYRPVRAEAGETLRIGSATGPGLRGYLSVRGGFDVPEYLGSRSTFMLGRFGGHGGRALAAGDVLRIAAPGDDEAPNLDRSAPHPPLTDEWAIQVLYGPHGSPDFFTEAGIEAFFAASWEVHFNSDRTGVRLIGPKPEWAREDGGDAGLHPSNIHDNAYAVGTIDFTGDMPIILGPDGPSLGGFVCPATVVRSELWKLGQLRPGDRIRFVPIDREGAEAAGEALDRFLESPWSFGSFPELNTHDEIGREPAVVSAPLAADPSDQVVYRRAGDRHLLVEFGPIELDLALRFKAHALMLSLTDRRIEGVTDLTPGIRSLQIQYDPRILSEQRLVDLIEEARQSLDDLSDWKLPSRIVHLPLSWDDSEANRAIEIYTRSVRSDAPWCPSNLEFIRRINGLDSIEAVREIVFSARYLVMGLGDVYLGAPVGVPLDPRHRLVTTKYNPARTWTAENSVGIGGAYMCVYGMEGPGGYQLLGRTVPVWNRYNETDQFSRETPWLLRLFDRIIFEPVSHEELLDLRRDVINGRHPIEVESAELDLRCPKHGDQQGNYGSEQSRLAPQLLNFGDQLATVVLGELAGNDISRAAVNPAPNGRTRDIQIGKEIAIPGFANGFLNSVVVGPSSVDSFHLERIGRRRREGGTARKCPLLSGRCNCNA